MKYICSVCGYVYDEDVEGVPFSELPDDWVCPMCRAPKSLFEAEESPEPVQDDEEKSMPPAAQPEEIASIPASVLSAVFSNLSRGAEKKYMAKEAELLRQISSCLSSLLPPADGMGAEALDHLLSDDLGSAFPSARKEAEASHDRGALRAITWSEKVTRMAKSIVGKYLAEGDSFLKGSTIWVCSICGFIYTGENPPPICPVCKVPDWRFERMGRPL